METWVFVLGLSYPLSAQRWLWSDWADAPANPSLRWAHMPLCWFCHEVAHIVCVNSDGSGDSHRLAWALDIQLCDKHHFFTGLTQILFSGGWLSFSRRTTNEQFWFKFLNKFIAMYYKNWTRTEHFITSSAQGTKNRSVSSGKVTLKRSHINR